MATGKNRPFALSLALPVLAALFTGCGHTETHVAMLRAPQPRSGHAVELYLADQATPARAFYDIAMVQAIGFGTDATPEEVTRGLTDKAAALGCDAVVRVFIDVGYSRAHAAGVCVKYFAEAAPGTAPAPMRPAPMPRLEPLPSAPNQGR
jgi:hypothetical protein